MIGDRMIHAQKQFVKRMSFCCKNVINLSLTLITSKGVPFSSIMARKLCILQYPLYILIEPNGVTKAITIWTQNQFSNVIIFRISTISD